MSVLHHVKWTDELPYLPVMSEVEHTYLCKTFVLCEHKAYSVFGHFCTTMLHMIGACVYACVCVCWMA